MINISLDFDDTLTRNDVQEFVKKNKSNKDITFYVITARYDSLHKHLFPNNPTNDDLWTIVDDLEIPRENVFFMNTNLKADFIKDSIIDIHLDDSLVEVERFKHLLGFHLLIKCKAILVDNTNDWKNKLNEYGINC